MDGGLLTNDFSTKLSLSLCVSPLDAVNYARSHARGRKGEKFSPSLATSREEKCPVERANEREKVARLTPINLHTVAAQTNRSGIRDKSSAPSTPRLCVHPYTGPFKVPLAWLARTKKNGAKQGLMTCRFPARNLTIPPLSTARYRGSLIRLYCESSRTALSVRSASQIYKRIEMRALFRGKHGQERFATKVFERSVAEYSLDSVALETTIAFSTLSLHLLF